MGLYHLFYEVREILSIGKPLDDETFNQQVNSRKQLVRPSSDFKNADVLYILFDKYWLHPVRTYISTKWLVKEDGRTFAEALTKWSYLMPTRFFEKMV